VKSGQAEGPPGQPGAHWRRRALRAAAALVVLAALIPPALAFDLHALAALLAERKSAEARFTEERTVSGLDGTLRSSGTLSFSAPDRFARQTLEPRAESMVVEGNTVSIRRGGRTRQMALDAVPELTALLAAVRGTLTGDAAALQQHFRVQLAGTAASWTMTLVPRDDRLAAQVRELQIVGQRGELRTLELSLAGGDRSLMIIEPLPPALPGSAQPAPGATPRSGPAAPR
jgi:outer membrane lipoprotein-sorting protein